MDHMIKKPPLLKATKTIKPNEREPPTHNQCDQMVESKVAQYPKSCQKCRTNSFYFKSDAFQKAQTVFQIFGLLLLKNLLPKLLKIAQSGRAAVTTHNQRPNRITGHAKLMIVLLLTHSLIRSLTNNPTSVIRKKSPNVYKSCPKMISLEK